MALLVVGWNQNSQLGLGDSETRVVPTAVASFDGSRLSQVVCGSRYTVVLTKRGNVFSFGRGDDFQLGHSKNASLATVPRLVQALESVVVRSVAARGAHTLALTQDGQVYAWGRNDGGQLGMGDRQPCKTPTLVRHLVDSGVQVAQIACGRVHSLAVSQDGFLFSWGSNEDGATGQSDGDAALVPALVPGVRGVTSVACGSRHSLVLVESSGAGSGNGGGGGGGGAERKSSSSLPRQSSSGAQGGGLSNRLLAFGWGTYGQLGLDSRRTVREPTEVAFPTSLRRSGRVRISSIACGYRHSLAVLEYSGSAERDAAEEPAYAALWSWGWNLYGQLGYATSEEMSLVPGQVSHLDSVVSAAGGGRHTLVVTQRASDGARRCFAFGANMDGQLGIGSATTSEAKPERVRCFGTDVALVAAGWSHSALLIAAPLAPSGERDAENQRSSFYGAGAAAAEEEQQQQQEQRPLFDHRSSERMAKSPSLGLLSQAMALQRDEGGGRGLLAQWSRTARRRLSSVLAAGNMDAGFGQFLNTLILLLNILTVLRQRVGIEEATLVGRIIPAATVTVFLSNIAFGVWAERAGAQSLRESGLSYTALPHGISTVLFFAFTMLIMAPVFLKTGDAEQAYRTGLAASLMLGVLELVTLFFVDGIRRVVPRAAMMSAMGGVALTFIAMTFTVQIFSNPAVGILPLTVILVCYGSNVQLPYKVPAGLLALVLGSAIVWAASALGIQLMDPSTELAAGAGAGAGAALAGRAEPLGTLVAGLRVYLPGLAVADVLQALADPATWGAITVVVPMLIVNIVNNLSCLEGAAAMGDHYSTRQGLALDAAFTILGALLGNPFPTCIYIGHSAFKSMGAGADYSYVAAVSSLLLGVLNGASGVIRVVPEVAGVGVILWIGIVVTAQAFDRDETYENESSATKSHAAAVALGLLPALAAWCLQYIQAALPAVSVVLSPAAPAAPAPVHVPFDKVMVQLESTGVYVYGLIALSRGYLLSSIFLSSMLVEIIDRKFKNAAGWMLLASALSFVGAVHSFELDQYGISSSYGFPSRTVGDFPLKYSFAYASCALLLMLFEMREVGSSLGAVATGLCETLCCWWRARSPPSPTPNQPGTDDPSAHRGAANARGALSRKQSEEGFEQDRKSASPLIAPGARQPNYSSTS